MGTGGQSDPAKQTAPDAGRLACSVCGATGLATHLRVAGDPGQGGLSPTTDRFGTALADIVRCHACGHMQISPMPTEVDLARGYQDSESHDYIEEEVGQRATARGQLARVEEFLGGPGRILDLGCWCGFLLAEARDRGWDTVGVEPSVFASRYARERFGLDVRTGDLFVEPLPGGHFDVVVLGDVIEHLPRPGDALERIAALLRPDGMLWMALPDAGSLVARALGRRWWSVIPTHVQYFTRSSLRRLLSRHGWTIVDAGTAPKAFTVRYYLGRTAGYSPPLARALVRAADLAGVGGRLWAPDFRDRMWILARHPDR